MNTWLIFEYREMHDWANVFDYVSKRKVIGRYEGIQFVIHPNEGHHNEAHLHAKYGEFDVSLRIPDGKVLAGKLPKKKQKIAVRWVKENQDFIAKKWDAFVDGVCLIG